MLQTHRDRIDSSCLSPGVSWRLSRIEDYVTRLPDAPTHTQFVRQELAAFGCTTKGTVDIGLKAVEAPTSAIPARIAETSAAL